MKRMRRRPYKDKKLVIWSGFNRAHFTSNWIDQNKPHPVTTRPWIEERMEIWKNTALRSILRQSYDDWIYLVGCDPSTQHIIDPLVKDVHDSRVIMDYMGTRESIERIKEIALEHSEIVTLRLDTDDMYHPDAALEVMTTDLKTEYLVFRRGYAYRHETKHLWKYDCIGTGPFFARRYLNTDEFAKKDVVLEMSHVQVRRTDPDYLSEGKFLVSITKQNTTTKPNSKRFYEKIYQPQKDQVLRTFGVKEW